MQVSKTQLLISMVVFLFAPVFVWTLLGLSVGIVSFSEIITILLSWQTILYILVTTSVLIVFFKSKLTLLDNHMKQDIHLSRDTLDKLIAALPVQLYLSGFMYVLLGSFIALYGRDFLDDREFIVYNLLSIPTYLLFSVPFFISFFRRLEDWVSSVHLPRQYKSLSFAKRLILAIFSSSIGSIWLIVVLNSYIYATHEGSLSDNIMTSVIFALLALAMIGVNVVFILKQTVNPVKEISKLFSQDQENLDKTLRINLRDEIGFTMKNINKFFIAIKETLQGAKDASLENIRLSQAVNSASLSMKESLNKQDTLIIKVSEKGSQMKSVLETSVMQADKAEKEMINNQKYLQEMHFDTTKMIASITQTTRREAELASNVSQLSLQAEEIKTVLTVISDVAEQTNLLALNAAIEAARAGEHGRGFAVVADEVRKLAERTQKSLSEVNATINSIVQSINDTSSQMEENVKEIEVLSQLSQEVEERLGSMNHSMEQMGSIIYDNAQSSTAIASQTEKMIGDIDEIKQLSYENYDNVSTMEKAGDDLKSLTENLDKRLNRLKT